MHSSIQFRHEAISTYGWRRSRSLWLFRSNTLLLADSDMCWRFWFLWGRNLQMETGRGERDTWLFSSIFGLDCVRLVVWLQVVCLLQLMSQTVSPVCRWEARSPSRKGRRDLHVFDLLRLLLTGGRWGWTCRSGLDGCLCGRRWSLQTLSPPPSS